MAASLQPSTSQKKCILRFAAPRRRNPGALRARPLPASLLDSATDQERFRVETTRTTSKWWGEFEVPHGQARTWRLGLLLLRVSRLAHAWRVSRQRSTLADDAFEVGTLGQDAPLDGAADV
jgi:hypothetical protein